MRTCQQGKAAAHKERHRRKYGDRRLQGRPVRDPSSRAVSLLQKFRSRLGNENQNSGGDQTFHQADRQMDGQHQSGKRAEGQFRNAGKARLDHDREGTQLQADHTAGNGSDHDLQAKGRLRFHLSKPAGAHDRPPDQEIADKAAVEGHVPDIGAQRHQPAVRKEQALNSQDNDHGEEPRVGPEQCGKQHPSAQMAG